MSVEAQTQMRQVLQYTSRVFYLDKTHELGSQAQGLHCPISHSRSSRFSWEKNQIIRK